MTDTPRPPLPPDADADIIMALAARLREADRALAGRYPGERAGRQPVHTIYGGAHLFAAAAAARLGALALRSLDQHAPDFVRFARAVGLPGAEELPAAADAIARLVAAVADDAAAAHRGGRALALAHTIHGRVREKLAREPVEDLRIDFEDGYGRRGDEEEDGHARRAGAEVAAGLGAGTLPPFIGLRIKALTEDTRDRSLRTLDLFLAALTDGSGGRLPPGFVITLPKVAHPAQVAVLAGLCALHERRLGLPDGALRFEIMIETTQAIIGDDGQLAPRRLVDAGGGRCVGAHIGTYDYTASCGVTAAHQRMDHPACDFARHVLQVSLAGTGVWLSDGATTVLPIGPHRPAPGGAPLPAEQAEDNDRAVHRAWRLHAADVRRSLIAGYYQGWDLHPAQLPSRYAAVYAFFLAELPASTARLRSFVDRAARASRVGDVFDDAATAEGLLNYFRRGLGCGAISAQEARATGLSIEEIQGRSWVRILEGRRGG